MKFIIDKYTVEKIINYNNIINEVQNVDVYADFGFRDEYCNYYGLSFTTNKTYQDIYFAYMQREKKNVNLTYKTILEYLYKYTGRIDYSFASKLLHTINQNQPILDKHVMRLLGFPLKTTGNAQERINYYVVVQKTVFDEYQKIEQGLKTGKNEIHKALRDFDKMFPCYAKLTITKKIDCILFRVRKERGLSVLG